jgi:Immunity protein 74
MKMTRGTLRITVDGRSVTAQGEAYLPGGSSPDFDLYQKSIVEWDDGGPVSDEERARIIEAILAEAKSEGMTIEIV